jgi:hypothetical protein
MVISGEHTNQGNDDDDDDDEEEGQKKKKEKKKKKQILTKLKHTKHKRTKNCQVII